MSIYDTDRILKKLSWINIRLDSAMYYFNEAIKIDIRKKNRIIEEITNISKSLDSISKNLERLTDQEGQHQ